MAIDPTCLVAVPTALALVSLGGGIYEHIAVDPFWPSRPELVQPLRGGITRRRFWIPAHASFELSLLTALFSTWSLSASRTWLLVALASHAIQRIWSALHFIPSALAFENTDPVTLSENAARKWTRQSLWRLPFGLTACSAMLFALASASRGA